MFVTKVGLPFPCGVLVVIHVVRRTEGPRCECADDSGGSLMTPPTPCVGVQTSAVGRKGGEIGGERVLEHLPYHTQGTVQMRR